MKSIKYLFKSHSFLILLLLSLLGALVISISRSEWISTFITLATIILMISPYLIDQNTDIRIPRIFSFSIALFMYATLFLGEIHGFYNEFWWWDVALHSFSAFGFGLLGLILLLILFRKEKVKASPLLLSVFSFSFALAIGSLWEVFEFTVDQLFGLNTQKSGLMDTMSDIIIDAMGASIAAIIGYFYLKRDSPAAVEEVIDQAVKKNI